ncbi:SH3 domain-containing protein [Pyricularia oryzae Y34]|uniref:SH3 domain-containing protein n=2 Tax=Pyricularia oryzae TaxID=318829 RepID=A0AA97NS62_PYRO3|nr:SH3 domain-containing protein [Pyricularia oryzae Y34]
MGINNPLPSSMASECKKCGKILASFIDPRQAYGPDKGLAILTVIKAGFVGSARFGSGLVIARLPDGSWSAPSAIATGGAGVGGQIGFELTDFVFILNDAAAVKTFSQSGSLTLGGNVSIAAGPVGRNAEAAGAASLRSVAGIFSYSKTKGLFAGVSLEGSAIVERKDANTKMYGRPVSAQELLTGGERAPPAAAPLINILTSRAFSGAGRSGSFNDGMYNDTPQYDSHRDHVVWEGRRGSAYGETPSTRDAGAGASEFGAPKRSATWQHDTYNNNDGYQSPRFGAAGISRSNTVNDARTTSAFGAPAAGGVAGSRGPKPPVAPKPNFSNKQAMLQKNQAVALFTFEADQPGDLGFKKGEIITVVKKTDSDNDWCYLSTVTVTRRLNGD